MSTPPLISVVVPMYGCESCIPELHRRLVAALEPLGNFEIVLVNDASPDASWPKIEELSSRDPRVKGIDLSRNFGQHYAIIAGIAHARGDYVVVMDCDLQNPPEEIPQLYARAKEGHPVVITRRVQRKDGFIKKLSSRAFNSVFGWLAGIKADPAVCNFSIISREVAEHFLRLRERNRSYIPNILWLGYSPVFVDAEHAERHSGKTTYTWFRQFKLAFESIIAQSNKPLRLSIGFGFLLALAAFVYGAFLIGRYFITGIPVAGWTSVMVSLYFLFGILFVNVGVVGLYLGEVYSEAKGRPLYLVRRVTASVERRATHGS